MSDQDVEVKDVKKRTEFEKFKIVRDLIVRKAMEGYVYRESWGPDFRIKDFDGIPNILKRWEEQEGESFTQLQPGELTEDEMFELGFRRWSEDSPMMLIPLWTLPFLAEVMTTEDINGKVETLKKSEMDNDHRFGCLAHGVNPKRTVNKSKELPIDEIV